ncbi:hypothetical protein ERO13_D10G132401v2 [Gossypium hirsutum]|uniref:CBM-cenC domain-containing protein n=1 Tax=Gossypium darwinii TaxID=34276 RepID=A0A5D2AYZ0_GOSDA|nr:hypothetical protein ERO13_D10G132401v2 [Gossypium hirsutum]TYG50197.1 hypothetical protein ES288_D10G155300v1 [Gossypium darwinii]
MRPAIFGETATGFYTPGFLLKNLTVGNFYCFSTWIKIQGANSALIRASLKIENRTYNCIGTVLAKNGCWSFLKGGFVLDSPSNLALLLFQNSDDKDIDITIDSSSLQPFTDQEWSKGSVL